MKINWKAVFLGVTAYWVGIFITAAIRGVVAMLIVASQGQSIETVQLDTTTLNSLGITFFNRALSMLFAGWVAARVTKQSELKYAALTGIIIMLFSITLVFFVQMKSPFWFNVTNWLAAIPMAILGGKICQIQREKFKKVKLNNNQPPIPEP